MAQISGFADVKCMKAILYLLELEKKFRYLIIIIYLV